MTDYSSPLSLREQIEQRADQCWDCHPFSLDCLVLDVARLTLDAVEAEISPRYERAKAEYDGDDYEEGRMDAFGHVLASLEIWRAQLSSAPAEPTP